MRRPVSSDALCHSALVEDMSMSSRKAAHLHISYAKTAAASNAFLSMVDVTGASGSVDWCGDCMSEVAHWHCTVPESSRPPEDAESLSFL